MEEKTSSSKWLGWLVLAIVVIGGGWWLMGHGSASKVAETGPIKIGFIGPLTGDAAVIGEPIQNGIKLAVTEINQNGGINGRQIEAIYEDGKCTGKDAVSAAQKLITVDQVKYIVGGVCSSEAFGFAPITSAAKVVVIMPGASAPKLSGVSPFVVRNNPNDNAPGIALADYLAKSYKNVAILSEQTDYAQGMKAVFVGEMQKNGLSVSSEDYNGDATDFRAVLSKVKAVNPDALFINAQTPANLLRVASQARQLGISAQFVSAAFNDPAVVGAGATTNGMVLADAPGLASAGNGPALIDAYKTAYGKEPTYAFYVGAAYDGIHLIAQAITSAGDDTTKVASYLHSLPSYTGTIGTYSFDQNGDIVGITSILQKIENGKLTNL